MHTFCRCRCRSIAARAGASTPASRGMPSGAARRKRKRENEKTRAWERLDALDGDVEAYEKTLELEATARRREAAATRRLADVERLNASALRGGDGRTDERRNQGTAAGSLGLANATRIAVRVARDSPHALEMLCCATSDGDCVFACAQPKSWGRRGIEIIFKELGFDVIEYDEVTLSKAPGLTACVVRLRAEPSTKKKSKNDGGSAAETLLARAEALIEPIQAPNLTDGEEDASLGGLGAWVGVHRRRRVGGAKAVSSGIDAWFEKKEAEEDAAREAMNAAKADDGWTVVQAKRGRKKTTADDETGTTVGGIRAATADGRRKEVKKIANEQFYRFQTKEKRRSEIMELQAKFEEDKQRIARLKAARKFKPL